MTKKKKYNLAVTAKEFDHVIMSNSVGSLSFLGQTRIQNIEENIERIALTVLGNGNVPVLELTRMRSTPCNTTS